MPTSGGDSFPRVIKKVGAALPSAGSGSLPKALKRAGAVLPSAGDLLGTGRLPKLFVGADDVLPTVVSKGLPVTGNGRLSAKLPKLLENANITLRVPAGNVPARSALDAGLSSLGSGIAGGLTGGATGALAFPGKWIHSSLSAVRGMVTGGPAGALAGQAILPGDSVGGLGGALAGAATGGPLGARPNGLPARSDGWSAQRCGQRRPGPASGPYWTTDRCPERLAPGRRQIRTETCGGQTAGHVGRRCHGPAAGCAQRCHVFAL